MRRLLGLVLAGWALAAAAPAWADAREANEETGIKFMERGRVHLSLTTGLGVDTNPNFTPWELITARQANETAQLLGGPAFAVPQGLPHPNKVLYRFPPDVFLMARPSMFLSLPGDRLAANAHVGLNYFEYLGVLNPGIPLLPGSDAQQKNLTLWQYNNGYRRLRTLDGELGGGVEINRTGPVGFAVNGGMIRSVDPGPIVVGTRLARTAFSASAVGTLRPGGGTMSFSGTATANAEIYDPQNGKDPFTNQPLPEFSSWQLPGSLLGAGNPADVMGVTPYANATVDPRQFHNAGLGLRGGWQWRFLPKSAFFANVGVDSRVYLWPFANPNGITVPVGGDAGFMGQLTARLGVVASLGLNYPLVLCLDPGSLGNLASSACSRSPGYLNGQPTDGSAGTGDLQTLTGLPISQYLWFAPELTRVQSYLSAPVAQLEARYQITPTFTATLGARRQMRMVPLYRYMSDNRVYGSVVGTLWNRLVLNLTVSESLQPYGALASRNTGYDSYPFDTQLRAAIPQLASTDPGRWDNDLTISTGVDIKATRWLLFGVVNTFNWHVTNSNTGAPGAPPGVYSEPPFNLSFVRNVTMLRAELRY